MWQNLPETADLATSTEEIVNGKLHFMCSEYGLASKEHQNNPFIGYVNINSLCNKINDLGKIVEKFKYTYYQFTKPNVMNPPQMSSFKWMTTSMPLLENIATKMGLENWLRKRRAYSVGN